MWRFVRLGMLGKFHVFAADAESSLNKALTAHHGSARIRDQMDIHGYGSDWIGSGNDLIRFG
jgi:hypothetical protein